MAPKKSLPQSQEPRKTPSAPRKRSTPVSKKKGSASRVASRSESNTSTISAVSQEGPPADPSDHHARIADRAHELYMHRGGHHGMDLEDWFEAERQVLEEGC